MYSNILVPVDLTQPETLDKAIDTAAALARHAGARLHMLGVTTTQPSSVAHTPEEYAEKLAAFARDKSEQEGATFEPEAVTSHDPAVDIDDIIMNQCKKLDIDLVVMASHVPGFGDHLFSSRAGWLASHSTISVFVVR